MTPAWLNDELVGMDIKTIKRAAFMFLTSASVYLMAIIHCNNCVRFVYNQKVSLYYGCYISKRNTESEKAFIKVLTQMEAYEKRLKSDVCVERHRSTAICVSRKHCGRGGWSPFTGLDRNWEFLVHFIA